MMNTALHKPVPLLPLLEGGSLYFFPKDDFIRVLMNSVTKIPHPSGENDRLCQLIQLKHPGVEPVRGLLCSRNSLSSQDCR